MEINNEFLKVARHRVKKHQEEASLIKNLHDSLREKDAELDQLRERAGYYIRALGSFVACQKMNIPAPAFKLTYTGFVITVLSGSFPEMMKACSDFVDDCQPMLEERFEKEQGR